jgi:hypothetical protein
MPFATQQDFPSAPADVQILLTGLLLLIPQDDGSCFMAVHNTSCTAHRLSIFVHRRGSDTPLARFSSSLRIAVEPLTNSIVTRFVSGDFARRESDDPRDSRWAVDFRALHGTGCNLAPGTRPGINLSEGLLHSFQRTDPNSLRVELVEPQRPPAPLNRIAEKIGANIYLHAGQQVVLRWNDDVGPHELRLPEANNPGTGYMIEIDNGPEDAGDLHNDFQEYYRILTGVSPNARRDLLFNGLPSLGCDPLTEAAKIEAAGIIFANIDAPCMSGLLDGGGGDG